jgi:FixJ family two-component response regulator
MTAQTEPKAELLARPQRVDVIDDDDSFRVAVVRMLESSGKAAVGYRCAGEYLLADPFDRTGCILLDMRMPGPSGLDLLDSLALRAISPPVVFVTGFGDVPASVRAIKAGAVDFLTKPVGREPLLRAVDRAFVLDAQRRAAWQELQELRERYERLSARERAVFAGIVGGKLNKQLAGTLGICERSIKSSRACVMRMIGATSLADLVKTARLLDINVENTITNKPYRFAVHGTSHGHAPCDRLAN